MSNKFKEDMILRMAEIKDIHQIQEVRRSVNENQLLTLL